MTADDLQQSSFLCFVRDFASVDLTASKTSLDTDEAKVAGMDWLMVKVISIFCINEPLKFINEFSVL